MIRPTSLSGFWLWCCSILCVKLLTRYLFKLRCFKMNTQLSKGLILFLLVSTSLIVNAQNRDYPIQAVPFTKVKLTDNFWLPRIQTNHKVTIPASFERCESTGRMRNFEMAAARSGKFCTVYPFDDTDVYKTIEGASFSLSLIPDKNL